MRKKKRDRANDIIAQIEIVFSFRLIAAFLLTRIDSYDGIV